MFEITAGELGAQNTIGAGGRYDGLIKDLGGPDLPSIGFATGLERVIQALIRQEAPLPQRKRPQLYAIPLGQQASFACFSLVKELRSKGFIALQDMSGKKLKNAMQIANDARAEYTLVLGDREIEEGICEIKEMDTGHVKKLPIAEVGLFFTTRYTKE